MNLRWWGFLSTMIAVTGAAGLQFTLTRLYPSTLTQILLFVLLFITSAAAALPLFAFLNFRFGEKNWRKKDSNRLLRQAAEVGLLAVFLAYLQLIQALDWMIAVVLSGVFILMETFFLTRN